MIRSFAAYVAIILVFIIITNHFASISHDFGLGMLCMWFAIEVRDSIREVTGL